MCVCVCHYNGLQRRRAFIQSLQSKHGAFRSRVRGISSSILLGHRSLSRIIRPQIHVQHLIRSQEVVAEVEICMYVLRCRTSDFPRHSWLFCLTLFLLICYQKFNTSLITEFTLHSAKTFPFPFVKYSSHKEIFQNTFSCHTTKLHFVCYQICVRRKSF